MSIGEIRAEVDAVGVVLGRVAGGYLTESEEVATAAMALTSVGKGSNRTELYDAVGAAHAAGREARQAAAAVAEAGRLCSAYVWQL